jgi:type IV pilus assembly protein PilY1
VLIRLQTAICSKGSIKMKSPTLRTLFLVASLLAGGNAAAEDIDIYAGTSSSARSNLLVVIDNSGSWNGNAVTGQCPAAFSSSTLLDSAGGVEACGMWRAVDAIGNTPALLDKINMGLMLLGRQSTNGGVFKFPATTAPSALVPMDLTGIGNMKTALQDLSKGSGGDTSNGRDFGGSTWEAWAFYTGKTGASGTTYPGISVDTCGKNFVIRVGIADNNAQPGDYNAGQVQAALSSAVSNAGADPALLDYIAPNWIVDNKFSSPTNFWADEWTRFMKQNNDITTYTITLVDTSASDTENVRSYKRFMKSVADVGGGKAFVVDINDMNAFVQALLQIFNEIQAVNSVFASASLPISVNAQGTFENQIFMGMFRPDATGAPRWAGNLKQYQFKLDTSNVLQRRLFMADALGNAAINAAGTGFFSPNAVSFWTSKNTAALPDSIDPIGANGVNGGTAGGFFIFNPQGAGEGFDLPDGEVVEKGGVAQRIRLENLSNNYTAAAGSATNPRRLFTCTAGAVSCTSGAPGSNLSDTPFATANDGITDALLGTTPALAVASITRSGTKATATLASAMSTPFTSGVSVRVAGSQYAAYNGTFTVGGPPTTTTFTYTIPTTPPTTATGTYTASTASVGAQSITSLSRSGTTVTANVPAHGFVTGQSVTITGATGAAYNGTFNIASAPANAFTYTITEGPATPGTGGTVTIGSNSYTVLTNGIVRGASNSSNVSVVTVTVTSNLANSVSVGNPVTITGASPTEYNVSGKQITGLDTNCPGGLSKRSFCFNFDTTPASPDVTGGMKAESIASVADITSLTRSSNTCSGGNPVATATARTSAAHGFATGQTVSVGGTPGADEAAYIGSFVITMVDATTFTYSVTTQPACSDATTGMTAAAALTPDKNTLINWVRGEDNAGGEPSPGNGINIRPSVHGDVLHSRPAVVAYPTQTNPSAIVVFYGANDGTFRAINGNQAGNIGTVPPGGELWSFIPPEFFGKLGRLYFNSPVIKLSSTSNAILPPPEPKNYFFDGSIGVFQDLDNNKVYLYITARRGGRLVYAVDVSDPLVPKFMWKRTNTDADTRFAELGQTWSQPKVALVKGYANPVLIFGGGYDPGQDAEPPTAATMGRAIYILDALTGNIVWSAKGGGSTNECIGNPCQLADMIYPIPSDVTLVDRNTVDESGFIDRIYVPDLGGNVWRVDLEPAGGNTPDQWQVTKLAAVGGTGTTKRKIFFPPDVVTTTNFDSVMFATGDREHPTINQQSVNIVNRFYMIKDTKVGNDAAGWTTVTDSTSSTANNAPTGLFNASPILPTSASSEPTQPGPVFDPSDPAFNGFYITLQNAVATKAADGTITYGPAIENGEKSVNSPTTVGGFTFFGTNAPIPPDPTICQANLGTARGYRIDFLTGESKFVVFDGGGLPPSPVAGVVIVDGVSVPFLIGGGNPGGTNPDDKSAIGGQEPPIPIVPIRSRTYWYRDLGNR